MTANNRKISFDKVIKPKRTDTKCKDCIFWSRAKKRRVFAKRELGKCNFKYGPIPLKSWPKTSSDDTCPECITRAEVEKYGICPVDYLLRKRCTKHR